MIKGFKTLWIGGDHIKCLPVFNERPIVGGVENKFAGYYKVVGIGPDVNVEVNEGDLLLLSANYRGEEEKDVPVYIKEHQILECIQAE